MKSLAAPNNLRSGTGAGLVWIFLSPECGALMGTMTALMIKLLLDENLTGDQAQMEENQTSQWIRKLRMDGAWKARER